MSPPSAGASRWNTETRDLPDASADKLVRRLFAADTSPSNHLMRQERHERLKGALATLPQRDREVLVMRHLEQLAPPRSPPCWRSASRP